MSKKAELEERGACRGKSDVYVQTSQEPKSTSQQSSGKKSKRIPRESTVLTNRTHQGRGNPTVGRDYEILSILASKSS
jgi:ATP-dependent Clp protease ATP-binding subunit ClpA